MQAGSRLHRRIQRQMGSHYQAEVPLKYEMELGTDLLCVVEGRADGIFVDDGVTTIDEIKGMYREPSLLAEPISVHLAQAKCYAFFYADANLLERIRVQMTYCSLETEAVRHFHCEYERQELEEWFRDLMREYEKWARFQADWKETRAGSIRPLQFPFPYREGQRELASDVYRAISRKKRLFIQAPTGVGKTISTVFPALKAMGEGLGDKLFT